MKTPPGIFTPKESCVEFDSDSLEFESPIYSKPYSDPVCSLLITPPGLQGGVRVSTPSSTLVSTPGSVLHIESPASSLGRSPLPFLITKRKFEDEEEEEIFEEESEDDDPAFDRKPITDEVIYEASNVIATIATTANTVIDPSLNHLFFADSPSTHSLEDDIRDNAHLKVEDTIWKTYAELSADPKKLLKNPLIVAAKDLLFMLQKQFFISYTEVVQGIVLFSRVCLSIKKNATRENSGKRNFAIGLLKDGSKTREGIRRLKNPSCSPSVGSDQSSTLPELIRREVVDWRLVLIVCCMLAHKGNADESLYTRWFGDVFGVSIKEMKKVELMVLDAVEWMTIVHGDEYSEMDNTIKSEKANILSLPSPQNPSTEYLATSRNDISTSAPLSVVLST
ncbi:uncharacterized protein MONOS_14413 [Monocercomonoides exilis]|uniref:uncharacterized protein n=1 Tax=Monocercomonoides exilis TaxID=2049356 RepID=UPI0035599BFD|nr:hypothetical protein MONOS_14413 [Monocercomonoides exilis]|eukprot:MONOS_14413.1-p1 / transcript=MONOS_14413.1 / gene=MONOS_14413 / organism=Monocercomonoides_exilis_PA203 / gene_product=unspecified product / transcript_product=unspecified product / location=Mono_scaffold00997:7018-8199(+) / protein_length=394 / sequence_SO=supercontig / SO=protein_coding / is_pseudo=false